MTLVNTSSLQRKSVVWSNQDQAELDLLEAHHLEIHGGRERQLCDSIDPELALCIAHMRRKRNGLKPISVNTGGLEGALDKIRNHFGKDNSPT